MPDGPRIQRRRPRLCELRSQNSETLPLQSCALTTKDTKVHEESERFSFVILCVLRGLRLYVDCRKYCPSAGTDRSSSAPGRPQFKRNYSDGREQDFSRRTHPRSLRGG